MITGIRTFYLISKTLVTALIKFVIKLPAHLYRMIMRFLTELGHRIIALPSASITAVRTLADVLWRHKRQLLPIFLILALKGLFYLPNLTMYPYYENDEATYAVRSLSFLRNGEFDMYTYWYDHAPGGWMFMSIWYGLTGQSELLGSALNSGRLFIFILTSISAVLVYLITIRFTKSKLIGLFAVVLFVLSPLSVYYQRRILLDNIMTFWTLLSLYFMTKKRLSLKDISLGGGALAMAIMTKINAVFFAPAMILALIWHTPKSIRNVGIALWAGVVGTITVLFPVYALLKGELFSKNPNPETGRFDNGISLLDSLTYQSSRGTDSGLQFWQDGSGFREAFVEWIAKDPLITVLALAGPLVLVVIARTSWRRANTGPMTVALTLLGFMIFMARGGVVLEFYFVPMVPLAAILASWVLYKITQRLPLKTAIYSVALFGLTVWQFNAIYNGVPFWRQTENRNLIAAVEWVESQIDTQAYVVSDNYAVLLLNFDGNHENLHYNFKYEYDDDINDQIADDWRNADYLIVTHEMLKQVQVGRTPFVRQMIDHSEVVMTFDDDTTSYIDLDKYISTNGDWVMVLKVKSDNDIIRQQAWDGFVNQQFKDYGRIIDQDDTTLSLYQSNSLVRALDEDRQTQFDGIWQWTKDHLQNRAQDRLVSSQWSLLDGEYRVADSNSNALADIEFAYALMRASEKWDVPRYQEEAEEIIADYWRYDIQTINGRFYTTVPGAQPGLASQVVNPSYSPLPYYNYFANSTVGSAYQWQKLIDDSYALLSQVQNPETGLFPNWIEVSTNGSIRPALGYAGLTANNYGYEAFRIPIWLGLAQDADPSDQRPADLLNTYGTYMTSLMDEQQYLPAIISTDGAERSTFDDTLSYGAAYFGIRQVDQDLANVVLARRVLSDGFDDELGVWLGVNINNQLWLPIITNATDLKLSAPLPDDEPVVEYQLNLRSRSASR